MESLLGVAGGVLLGVVLAAAAVYAARIWRRRKDGKPQIAHLIAAFLHPVTVQQIIVSEREFPYRIRADLQRAMDHVFGNGITTCYFSSVRREYPTHEGADLAELLLPTDHNPGFALPPQYEEIDVGDPQPLRTLKEGLWFLRRGQSKFVVLLSPRRLYRSVDALRFQIAAVNDPDGLQITRTFFEDLEAAVLKAESYRGKVLSLEQDGQSYSGKSTGIKVHKLRSVERDQVILPGPTLELLDRNVIQFVRQRPQLARFRQATKKGILFYGPPGTGKTHTIHYLARALPGHTTLLVTAEQVGLLDEYMTLARLLQPAIVVIEDADLIARERTQMGVCQEVLLNKLLNEMDGLREEADILFVLTTNRPETLEHALASRPGRVDQAIEFPLPDDEGREKLVRLYSSGIEVPPDVSQLVVRRTDRVSAAFIKELMRRSVQFHLEANGTGSLTAMDVDSALQEMLFSGGSLNLKLLGAEGIAAGQ